mmetsp:Transcript_15682/g.17707  ORF Transcript_15682/g.17707 Transcript_15682/m.17707 type:complete len:473 (+) Transcript_15682:165-1583(+)
MADEQFNCSQLPELAEVSPENASFGFFLSVFGWSYFVFFITFFFFRRQRSEYLQKRNFVLLFLAALSGSYCLIVPLREYLGRNNISCIAVDIYPHMIALLVLFHFARIYIFILKIQYNIILAKASYLKVAGETKLNGNDQVVVAPANISENPNLETDITDFRTKQRFGCIPLPDFNDLETVKYLMSTRALLAQVSFFVVLIVVSLAASVRWERAECTNCELDNGIHSGMLVTLIVIAGFVLRALWSIRKEPDVLNLYFELYNSSIVFVILGTSGLILQNIDFGDIVEDGKMNWLYLPAIAYLLSFSIIVPKQIFRSFFMESFDDSVNHLGLRTILNSQIGINYFKIHMINELSIESILFFQNAMGWKSAFRTTSVHIREENYLRIFNTFIERGSIMQINVSENTYKNVLKNADRSKNIPESIFDECIDEAIYLMSSNAFPRFLRSELYQRYLSAARGDMGTLLENEGYYSYL